MQHQEPMCIILIVSSIEGIGMNWFLLKILKGLSHSWCRPFLVCIVNPPRDSKPLENTHKPK